MSQIFYSRPTYLLLTLSIIATLSGLIGLPILILFGVCSPTGNAIFIIGRLAELMNRLFDPDTTYKTTSVLKDGRTVRVKRPLVGFKACEMEVGRAGGFEVRPDGWRYEYALLRI